jgi:hypothetical protein
MRTENKQRQTALRKLERQEAELSLPAVYSNGEKAREVKQKIDECAVSIEAKTHEWETVVAEMEK